MEQTYYELRPYAFLILAFAGPKASHGSTPALFFAGLLILGSAVILHARLVHRGVLSK